MISDTDVVFPGKPSEGPGAQKPYWDLTNTRAFTNLTLALAPSGSPYKIVLITFFE